MALHEHIDRKRFRWIPRYTGIKGACLLFVLCCLSLYLGLLFSLWTWLA